MGPLMRTKQQIQQSAAEGLGRGVSVLWALYFRVVSKATNTSIIGYGCSERIVLSPPAFHFAIPIIGRDGVPLSRKLARLFTQAGITEKLMEWSASLL